MAKHYSKERAKYGSGAGSIIVWPVEYTSLDPSSEDNVKVLPAGYLKCDGTKYNASDYPTLAEIIGTGSACKFIRYDIAGDPIDVLNDDEFVVPDFGSKFPKPTSGASAGEYINILTKNKAGVAKTRSGMGIEATPVVGSTTGATTVIPVTYTGNFNIPSQEISIKGKPSWSKGTNNSGYTDNESVDSLALHSHMHFSSTNRLRIKTTNETSAASGFGVGYRNVASTVPISTWLDNTQYPNGSSNKGSGTNQPPCWAIASGVVAGSYNGAENVTIFDEVIYYNLCYDLKTVGGVPTGLNALRYQCLLTSQTTFDLQQVTFFDSPKFKSWARIGSACTPLTNIPGVGGAFPAPINPASAAVPATYTTGALGVPVDYNGVSLSDVVPMNVNTSSRTSQSYPQVNNVVTEIQELEQTTDPTIHAHKINFQAFDHTYKIKTSSYLLSPDNLSTILTLKTDDVASLDEVTSPYIIMEYLIKY